MKTITLFRPVGLKEMELIAESGFKAFSSRLAWQPIFYPVMNQQYAEQIALEWNTNDEFSGFIGIVTAFDVNEDYLKHYEVQNVGGTVHNELWIPAEELNDFNNHISGTIEIVNVYFTSRSAKTENLALNSKLEKFKK
ncbi:hypothetical protein [Pedobacter jeongneungensis]|uniref:hypothetical protein n=1 Tax=Pedobacter jeongneungensis TaxID=947309 RepID=UPI000469B750|nr:hypothetical protein [Pedobacter jeongneungensis]